MYLAELQNPAVSHLLVAKDPTGQVTGFCGFWCVADELHINNLAVLPEHRRQGIASAILSRVFAEGRRAGAARATLEVRRSNHIARRGRAARHSRGETIEPHRPPLVRTLWLYRGRCPARLLPAARRRRPDSLARWTPGRFGERILKPCNACVTVRRNKPREVRHE